MLWTYERPDGFSGKWLDYAHNPKVAGSNPCPRNQNLRAAVLSIAALFHFGCGGGIFTSSLSQPRSLRRRVARPPRNHEANTVVTVYYPRHALNQTLTFAKAGLRRYRGETDNPKIASSLTDCWMGAACVRWAPISLAEAPTGAPGSSSFPVRQTTELQRRLLSQSRGDRPEAHPHLAVWG